MLKYEEKLHFDERYKKLQSNHISQRIIRLLWTVIGYGLIYACLKYVFLFIPDIQPWNHSETWFTIYNIKFIKADLLYFVGGLIANLYGAVRLSKITIQNHSAKDKKNDKPKELLHTGYYGKVRHPMYGTFLILQAGCLLPLRSLAGIIVTFLLALIQYLNAITEEKHRLIPIFREKYQGYQKNVKAMLFTKPEAVLFLLPVLFSALGFAF